MIYHIAQEGNIIQYLTTIYNGKELENIDIYTHVYNYKMVNWSSRTSMFIFSSHLFLTILQSNNSNQRH